MEMGKRHQTRIHPIWWMVIGFFVFSAALAMVGFVWGYLSGIPNSAVDEQSATEQGKEKQWVLVATFTGRTNKNTETFTVGDEWKIKWATKATDSVYTLLRIQIYRPGDEVSGFVGEVAGSKGDDADESMQYTPGTYYLRIITASQPYAIQVWDKR